MNIALFDLDNTLIKGDSDYQWGNYLVENNYVDPVYYKEKNDNFFKQYRNGTLCAREFAQFSYEPFTKYSYETLVDIGIEDYHFSGKGNKQLADRMIERIINGVTYWDNIYE